MKIEISRGADMYVSRLTQQTFLLIGAVISIAACAKPKTASVSQQLKPIVETTNIKPVSDWSPKQIEGVTRYVIQDSASISINNDSAHSSSIQARIVYELTYSAQSDSLLLTAKVESLTTTSHQNGISRARSDTTSTQFFSVSTSNNGKIGEIREQNRSQCMGGIDPNGTRILELIISYPRKRIRVGDKWTDTVSTTTCRGKTALLQQSIRSYELMELANSDTGSLAKISRNVTTTFTTVAVDAKDHLAATGTGSSSSIIYATTGTGAVKSSSGQSYSTLAINTSRGSYPFTQNVCTRIESR